jgi:hypothetical protein
MPARGWRRLPAACGAYLKGLAARPKALAAVAAICVVVLAGIGIGAYFLATRGNAGSLHSAATEGADDLYPVLVDGKIGFIDRSGKMVIEPRQQDGQMFPSGFSDGRALTVVNGKVGFIDTKGDYVIPPQYDNADDFSEGLAAVWQGSQVLYVDTAGNVVVELPGVTGGGRFSEGMAGFGVSGDSGTRFGYIDKQGHVAISAHFLVVGEFSDGLASVEVEAEGDVACPWGYIDKTGGWVIEPEYTWAGPFSNGLAPVRKSSQDYGFIDKSGAWAIHPKPSGFLYAGSFSEGLACVEVMAGEYHDTPKFGFIDTSGDIVIAPVFDTPGYFSQGRAAVGVRDEDGGAVSWGYIDKSGDWVVEPTYLKAGPFQPGGLAAVVRSGSAWMVPDPPRGYLGLWTSSLKLVDSGPPDVAYIDLSGKVIWQASGQAVTTPADSTADYDDADQLLYPVLQAGKIGYLDRSGQVAIGFRDSAYWAVFSEGLAAAELDGKMGFIDSSGAFAIPPTFDHVDDFHEGLAFAVRGAQSGYIDQTGDFAIRLKDQMWGGPFSEGLAWVADTTVASSRCGFIDRTGNTVIPLQFAQVGDFHEGRAAAAVQDDSYGGMLWGYIDKTGEWVVKPTLLVAGDFSDGLAAVQQTGFSPLSWGYIDTTGAWVVQPGYQQAGPFSEEGLAMVVRSGQSPEFLYGAKYLSSQSFAGDPEHYYEEASPDMAYIDRSGRVVWQTPPPPATIDSSSDGASR